MMNNEKTARNLRSLLLFTASQLTGAFNLSLARQWDAPYETETTLVEGSWRGKREIHKAIWRPLASIAGDKESAPEKIQSFKTRLEEFTGPKSMLAGWFNDFADPEELETVLKIAEEEFSHLLKEQDFIDCDLTFRRYDRTDVALRFHDRMIEALRPLILGKD